MRYPFRKNIPRELAPAVCFIAVVILVYMVFAALTQKLAYADGNRICSQTTRSLYSACVADLSTNYYTNKAACLNFVDSSKRRDCFRSIVRDKWQGRRDCRAIRYARQDLCGDLGEQAYDPAFGEGFAEQFVDPTEIGERIAPNPYLPLVEGNTWTYQSVVVDEEGETITETIRVTVTGDTKQIEGITCVVVKDVVDENGAVIEDTDDWYAQDLVGNVWYCGEIAMNYESFDGDTPETPELTDIDGSWKSGRDFSKAGIQFPAVPEVGEVIRQEVAWREAEDVIEVLSVTGTESSPGASCENNCLVTRDFTPLDPGANETKYFAPGVGLILEIDAEGNRVELISFTSL